MSRKNTSEIRRTNIDDKVKLRLWGMTAGRCEICNKILYEDSRFGDDANFAENAHIHAVGSTGPRHRKDITQDEINQIDNLMLLCAEHHHLIDTKPENYSGDFLIKRKKAHEERIRRLTEIQDDASCKMVTFFSNIDNAEVFSDDILLKRAVVREYMYPKQDAPILLHEGAPTRYTPTRENIEMKAADLTGQVKQYFGSIVKKEEAVALFALAPQPLLFKLGTLLSDQLNVHVFQCHREGEKWAWPDDCSTINYITRKTIKNSNDIVALVIDLSAEIIDDRITSVLGDVCTVFHLTIDEPNRLFVRNKHIQDEFVRSFRAVMERIKNEYPEAKMIHIFPAMPQSLAIRAGMDYMPKADLPVTIYEQVSVEKGFIETLTIGGEQNV